MENQRKKREAGRAQSARLNAKDGRPKPDGGPNGEASHQDVPVEETQRCDVFHMDPGEIPLLVHPTGAQEKSEKGFKPRVAPPGPATDVVTAVRSRTWAAESHSCALKHKTLSSHSDVLPQPVAANAGSPEEDVVPEVPAVGPEKSSVKGFGPSLAANSSEEKEAGDMMVDDEAGEELLTAVSSTLPTAAPAHLLKDWTGLEKKIQTVLREFLENQLSATSSTTSSNKNSLVVLSQQVSESEELLENTTNQEPPTSTVGVHLKAGGSLKETPEVGRTSGGPDSSEPRRSGTNGCVVSQVLAAASLEHHDSFLLSEEDTSEGDTSEGGTSERSDRGRPDVRSWAAAEKVARESLGEEEPAETFFSRVEGQRRRNKCTVMRCEEESQVAEARVVGSSETQQRDSGPRHLSADWAARVNADQDQIVVEETAKVPQNQQFTANSDVGGSSAIRRVLATAAGEIQAVALPEVLTNDDGGPDVDSCEEANEGVEPQLETQRCRPTIRQEQPGMQHCPSGRATQPATPQHLEATTPHRQHVTAAESAETKVLAEDVDVGPHMAVVQQPGGRKTDQNRTKCKIS